MKKNRNVRTNGDPKRPLLPVAMTDEEFQRVVEVFRILAQWRDEKHPKDPTSSNSVAED